MPTLSLFQTSLDFATVSPRRTANRRGGVESAPADANVTARIEDDTSGGLFKILSISTFEVQEIDPKELPHGFHGHPKELKLVSRVAGAGPLSVDAGQAVGVDVSFRALIDLNVEHFTATLVIEGDAWPRHVHISMTADVAGVTVEQVGDPVVVVQGESAAVRVRVTSLAGPATTVTLFLPGVFDGISMIGATAVVPPRGEVLTGLRFAAAPASPTGVRELGVMFAAFNNEQQEVMSPGVRLNVGFGQITVDAGSLTLVQPHASVATIPLNVTVLGAATDVAFSQGNGPKGVTVSSLLVSMPAHSSGTHTVQLAVDPQAPLVTDALTEIKWSAYGGQQTGSVMIPITITAVSEVIRGNMPGAAISFPRAGDLECTGITIVLSSSGQWSLSGSVHDHGTLAGDKFMIGFACRFHTDTDGLGHMVRGVAGAVFGPTRSVSFRVPRAGMVTNEFLRLNWQQVFAEGVMITMKATPDLSQPFSDLGDAIVDTWDAIKKGFRGRVGGKITCSDVDGDPVGDCQGGIVVSPDPEPGPGG